MMLAEKTIRVMLIDDHKTMLWGLARLIEGENSRMEVVGTASNCDEALAQIGQLAPDVILLDLDLGGKCSLDILPALLANGVSRALILTGTREQATLDLAVLRGARGVVRKDASAEQVLKAIEKVHQGELWLDHEMLGRVFGEFMNPMAARRPDPEAEKKATLTPKERKIIDTIVEGNGALNKALAQRLFISDHTLRNHLTSIYQKLGVSNRLELYVYAIKHQFGKCAS
jgi:DNA-binding NarL/FixJ family response regulator